MAYKFKIGIIGWSTGENSFGATKAYLYQLSRYGQVVVLGPHEDPDPSLDMVFMPGGKDTASWFNNERPSFYNTDADQFKEYFMHNTLPAYIEKGTPIWGTCLGMQQLCIHFGSKLTQHLSNHETTNAEKRWEPAHELIVSPEFYSIRDTAIKIISKGKTSNKKIKFEGNSLHHQGIEVEDLAEEIKLVAQSPDHIVEMIEHSILPIAGNQGHMEDDWNILSLVLFNKTLRRSPKYLEYKLQQNNEEVHN